MSAMNGYAEPDEGQPAFFTEPQNQVLSALIAELQDTGDERLEQVLRSAVTALRQEQEVELAVVRDELLGRIESRVFGVQLADFDPDQFKRAVSDLRSDVTKRFEQTVALMDKLAERIDSVDKRRRYDRNTARTEGEELATKLATLMAAQATAFNRRLDDLDAKIDALHSATSDALDGR
jgi:hypothetical protein